MSSATYLLSEKNETISWTYDRLLSNASIEKKDLSLIGFITGIFCIISILFSFVLRILIYFYSKISFIQSSSILNPTTTTDIKINEF